jgi:hypothetical protein
LKTISKDHFTIDQAKVEDDARFDGAFVLRTNTDLNPREAMLCYKQLWIGLAIGSSASAIFVTRATRPTGPSC